MVALIVGQSWCSSPLFLLPLRLVLVSLAASQDALSACAVFSIPLSRCCLVAVKQTQSKRSNSNLGSFGWRHLVSTTIVLVVVVLVQCNPTISSTCLLTMKLYTTTSISTLVSTYPLPGVVSPPPAAPPTPSSSPPPPPPPPPRQANGGKWQRQKERRILAT